MSQELLKVSSCVGTKARQGGLGLLLKNPAEKGGEERAVAGVDLGAEGGFLRSLELLEQRERPVGLIRGQERGQRGQG